MILGFSTGCLYKTHDALDPKTIDIFRRVGCNAIELMVHGPKDAEKILKLTSSDLVSFDYISLHAPKYEGKHQLKEYKEALNLILKKHREFNFDGIVLHPDMFEREEFSVLKQFDLPFAIENMDNRKASCKNVEDLVDVFELMDVPMVFDVNHVYSNDPTLILGNELIDAFGRRIEQIHLSGFDTFHDPVYKTKQNEIMDLIPEKNMPIIIESVLESAADVQKEYEYIKSYLEAEDSPLLVSLYD